MSAYINFNGSVIDASQPVLTHSNRAFRYGDALFETIRLMNGEILYFDHHLERLKRSMKVLDMEWHPDFTFQNLHLLIRHLDQVNELKGNARIRFEIFRNDGGLYTPVSNKVSYLIEAEDADETKYVMNETGLKVEFFTDVSKPINKLSNLKTSNALTYVLAGIFKKKHRCDDCIIFNSEGNVAEAIASNIFIVVKDEVFTPSLDQACIAGVMRQVVMDTLRSSKRKVTEKKITTADLLQADEIFLTNVVHGIKWVGAMKNKRYFNKFSKTLFQMIGTDH